MKILKSQNERVKILLIILFVVLVSTLLIFGKFIDNRRKNKVNIRAKDKKSISVSTSSRPLSDKKIEWGLKRNDNHQQPEISSNWIKLLKENNGIAIGNNSTKYIYLTFDEGYEAGYTKQILETLKNNNVIATFFITAHYCNSASDLVKQMIDYNQIVGNHTCNHKSMPSISNEEINREVMDLHKTIYEKYGYEMKYLRPPKGEFSERTLAQTASLGYKSVLWSFAYLDWDENKQPNLENAKKKILDNVHNGEIMLLHGNSITNASILDSVIKEIKNMGYEFRSLDDFEE